MTTAAIPQDRTQTVTPATRWLVLSGAIIVQLILGTVYGYSIFWAPLEAKIYPPIITEAERETHIAGGQELGNVTVVADAAAAKRLGDTRQGYLKYAFAICILSFAVVMVIAGRIQDVTGPRFPAVVGACFMAAGFVLAGLMNNPFVFLLSHAAFTGAVGIVLLMVFHVIAGKLNPDEYPIIRYAPLGITAAVAVAGVTLGNQYVGHNGEFDQLFLLWGTVGFLAGAGIGFAYVCPIAALIKWFPKQKGLVSGLAVAGFGFGAYVFKDQTVGALAYINARGVLDFFLVHAGVCLVGITLGAMLLRNPPGTPAKVAGESDWQETLRRPAFYVLWLMYFSGALAGLMVIGIVAVFAGEQLVEAQKAAGAALDAAATKALLIKGAAAVGYLAIFNALGRIAWGLLSDRIGRTTAFVAMFVFQAVMMFLLAGMKTEFTIAIGACIVGFNYGGIFALFPSATAELFGAKNLGANYGWLFTSYGIAGLVGIAAGNTAKTMTGSYQAAFVLAGCLCVVSAILAIGLQLARQRAPVVG
jgi:OFA family oxalate/formate antiporter-like MFS transporter